MQAALEGVRVLEVGSFITGPYAGQLLADLGAEVIKIEAPDSGDPFRSWGEGLYSPHYCAYNRNKQSLTLNLRSKGGKEVFERLLTNADVLIENFRSGVTERLGIAYEQVQRKNPRLIYCSISGMGQNGPYAKRPAYDTVGQALSGLSSMLVDLKAPQLVGPAFSDNLTGLFACYGILGALFAREKSGAGQLVEVNMLTATLAFLVEPAVTYFVTGESPGPHTRPRMAQAYAFTCSDGKALAVHLSSPPKFWEGLTDAVGHKELRDDPRFRTRKDRVANYAALRETLADWFKTQPREHWLAQLEQFDVPYAPIYTMSEVFEDPQVRHLGLEVTVQHEQMGSVRSVVPAVRMDGTPLSPSTAPPTLGEHTEAILHSLGYDTEAIRRLRQEQAI